MTQRGWVRGVTGDKQCLKRVTKTKYQIRALNLKQLIHVFLSACTLYYKMTIPENNIRAHTLSVDL